VLHRGLPDCVRRTTAGHGVRRAGEYLSTFPKKVRSFGPFIRSRRHLTLRSNGFRDFLLLETSFEIYSRPRDILAVFVCVSNYWIVSSAVENAN